MRIRKNAKLNGGSSVLLENFQSHVTCQLNQSPWDVIPFGSDSPQFEGEGSFTGNGGSPGDSIGAVESVASMMDTEDKSLPKIEDMVFDDNDDNGIAFDKAENNTSSSCQCKNQPKQGQSFCEHHNLSLIHATSSSKKPTAAAAAGTRRAARPRAAKKNTPSSNPYEFYYYSGFGPLWGKRRGDRNGGGGNKNEAKGGENSTITEANATPPTSATTIQSSPCSSSLIDNEGFDYDDEDDDDEEDDEDEEEVEDGNEESGKKRTRKPVKARSLKSLM